MRVTFKQRAARWDKFTTHVTYTQGRRQEGGAKELTFLIEETRKMTQEETRWFQGTQRWTWGLRMRWQGQALRGQLKNLHFESSVRSFKEESHITQFFFTRTILSVSNMVEWKATFVSPTHPTCFMFQPVHHSQRPKGAWVQHTEILENFPHKCTTKGGELEHVEVAEPREQQRRCPQRPDLQPQRGWQEQGRRCTWLQSPPAKAAEPRNLTTLDMATLPYSRLPPQQQWNLPLKGSWTGSAPGGYASNTGKSKASMAPQVQEVIMKATGQSEVEGTKCWLSNINRSSWGKRTKNVCYSAVCWKIKERPLISNLSCYQSQAERLLATLNVPAEEQFHQTISYTWRTIVILYHKRTMTILQ